MQTSPLSAGPEAGKHPSGNALPINNVSNDQVTSERLVEIDVLRGIAVLMVVLNHIPHYAMGGFRENPFFFPALLMDYGYLGVSLFVIISGFCIHRRTAINQKLSKPKTNWVEFWKRRFWRLYPPYLVAIILSSCTVFLLPSSVAITFYGYTTTLLCHLLFVQNITTLAKGELGNPVYWSLGMEEQLYLLYIPLLALLDKLSWPRTLILVGTCTLLWRLAAHSPVLATSTGSYGLGSWGLWPFSFWLYWALGSYAADGYYKNIKIPKLFRSKLLAVAFLISGFVLNVLFFRFIFGTRFGGWLPFVWDSRVAWLVSACGEVLVAFGFFTLLNWMVLPGAQRCFQSGITKFLGFWGKISYSVYLTHFPTINFLSVCLPFGHSILDWMLRISIYLVVCLVVSVVFYVAVERWFLKSFGTR